MKKLLVVGDSFMRPDVNFPGQHWSEMLPEYDVLMYAQDASSNGIIAYQFFQGLKQNPDAVVIGFTMYDRLEFENTYLSNDTRKWYTNANVNQTTFDQRLAVDLYKTTVCEEMMAYKSLLIVRSLLLTCVCQGLHFAYTLNGLWSGKLFNPISKKIAQHDQDLLSEFHAHQTPSSFVGYANWKYSPGFHVDDPEWQQRFAQEAMEILKLPVDNFYKSV